MGAFGIWHWVIVITIVVLLFGRGRVSNLMSDLGRGIGLFKREIAEIDTHEHIGDLPRAGQRRATSPDHL